MSENLSTYTKKREYLICVDSDGCAMDTMDVKHIKCFGPCMVEEWNLSQWRDEILKRWNEINLYTMTRGVNRFKGLALMLREVNDTWCTIDKLEELETWTSITPELSNHALEEEMKRRDSIILKKALSWSEAVNESINQLSDSEKQPFSGVLEGLQAAHACADVAIVSSANLQAVLDEWELHGLLEHTDIVLAQDAGSKAYCIEKLIEKGYEKSKVLMVGDAPGDQKAAQKNGVFFYPILVRREKESWERLKQEGIQKLIEGKFAGEYQRQLNQEFERNLS